MFALPSTWGETRAILSSIQTFFDHSPMIYVQTAEHQVQTLDFDRLCACMSQSLENFLRTGLPSAWHLPVQIHGPHADWILITCGLVPERPNDFVIRWNARCILRPPFWAVNRPGFAAFFPHLASVKNNCGQLDTFVWQQIWQQAVVTFFHGNILQQLVELKHFCEQDMANTSWRFREDVLLSMLQPKQKEEWLQSSGVSNAAEKEKVVERQVDGFLTLPLVMSCCNGDRNNAAYFCTNCQQLYCNDCSLHSDHSGHVFKFLKQ